MTSQEIAIEAFLKEMEDEKAKMSKNGWFE